MCIPVQTKSTVNSVTQLTLQDSPVDNQTLNKHHLPHILHIFVGGWGGMEGGGRASWGHTLFGAIPPNYCAYCSLYHASCNNSDHSLQTPKHGVGKWGDVGGLILTFSHPCLSNVAIAGNNITGERFRY